MTAIPSNKKLTQSDLQTAATALSVTIPHIRAIIDVETSGSGFLPTGEPTTLFERHLMYRYSVEKYGQKKVDAWSAQYPDIINKIPGGYGTVNSQPSRIERAATLIDRDLALKSASWGLGQVLGSNFKSAGFATLQAFINAAYRSEGDQLMMVATFIKNNKAMWDALKVKDWAGFASRYNGSNYKINQYDVKLAQAYKDAGGK